MPTIPPFDAEGLLPPGDYEVTFDELRASILASGPDDRRTSWDTAWRLRLIDDLEILSRQLWQVGVHEIFADGSFAEDKDHPNDIDGYFECSLDSIRTGELTREFNRIDPFKVWTWDPATRRPWARRRSTRSARRAVRRARLRPARGSPRTSRRGPHLGGRRVRR